MNLTMDDITIDELSSYGRTQLLTARLQCWKVSYDARGYLRLSTSSKPKYNKPNPIYFALYQLPVVLRRFLLTSYLTCGQHEFVEDVDRFQYHCCW